MLENYIKIAWRNLWRNKVYSFINIFGLALGLASAIIILLSIENELTFDRYYPKHDRLYRVWNREVIQGKIWCWAATCSPLAPALKDEIPEVQETARMTWSNQYLVAYYEKSLNMHGNITDPGLLTMFSFPFVKGDPNTALNEINSVVLTESCARKIFGNEDPMNKVIKINNKDYFTVTGVLKDLPNNTSFDFEILLPWKYVVSKGQDEPYWGSNTIKTFAELKPHTSGQAVSLKMKNILKEHSHDITTIPFLHAADNWNLYSEFENGKMKGGRIVYVRLISIIALFILLIACINFMNLSTAHSENRAKEVGIRKVVGAERKGLVAQFLSESVFIAFVAFLLSLFLVELLLPSFNNLTGKELAVDYHNPWYWIAGIAVTLFTGIVAGSYPAFYLSSFLPVRAFKNSVKAPKSSLAPRKILVVFQFMISITLIICTIVIEQQIRYAQNRPKGFNIDNLIFYFALGDLRKNYHLVKDELVNTGTATGVFCMQQPITSSGTNTWGVTWKGCDPNNHILFDLIRAQDGFVKPLDITLLQGRDLDINKFPSDSTACLINEAAMKIMKLKDPVGQTLNWDSTDFHITGVFKDFIWGSPYENIRPMIVMQADSQYVIHFRLNSARPLADNIEQMRKIFKKYNPAYEFQYHFADEQYAEKFKEEKIIAKLAIISSILAIIISCLGLFGLAAFTAEQRTKEIGVRRVLGASVFDIVALLSKDFLKLVILAAVIAFPIAWWAMNIWLQDYPYRITVGIWVFLIAGLIAVLIALITVTYQAIKAAVANPVKSLRSE